MEKDAGKPEQEMAHAPIEVRGKYIAKNPRVVKVKMNSRTAKFFMARKRGLAPGAAAIEAGYKNARNVDKITQTKQYEAVAGHYKDALLDKISLSGLAEEHLKNIVQDKDRGAKNAAIKMALEKIEPGAAPRDEEERVLVILR